MEHLNQIVLNILKEFAEDGPRDSDFARVKEYMNKSYSESLKENSYWMNILDNKYFYGEDNHTHYIETVNSITKDDIQGFVKALLDQGNLKTVVMLPEITE